MTTATNAEEILNRLQLWEQTGKRDYLIDVAKFCMWQWIAEETNG